jgi:hypothetical protein
MILDNAHDAFAVLGPFPAAQPAFFSQRWRLLLMAIAPDSAKSRLPPHAPQGGAILANSKEPVVANTTVKTCNPRPNTCRRIALWAG